jgi:hypothetical protein
MLEILGPSVEASAPSPEAMDRSLAKVNPDAELPTAAQGATAWRRLVVGEKT